jgi:hypothetical protein
MVFDNIDVYLFTLSLSDRIEDLILVDVAGVLVMVVVRNLPRVVRDHDHAVQQIAELKEKKSLLS